MSDLKTEGGSMPIRIERVDTTPKKITQQDINNTVKDVIEKAEETRLSPTSEALLQSAGTVTINRLKNLVPEKARQVLRPLTEKAALIAASLMFLTTSSLGAYAASAYGEPPQTYRGHGFGKWNCILQ